MLAGSVAGRVGLCTGLDVTTQHHVLETVRSLCRSYGVAAVYVNHDLLIQARRLCRTGDRVQGSDVAGGRPISMSLGSR